MRILLSPAKKMKYDDSPGIDCAGLPFFLRDAETIRSWLRTKSPAELKEFDLLGYRYHEERSSDSEYVFLREKNAGPAADWSID